MTSYAVFYDDTPDDNDFFDFDFLPPIIQGKSKRAQAIFKVARVQAELVGPTECVWDTLPKWILGKRFHHKIQRNFWRLIDWISQ